MVLHDATNLETNDLGSSFSLQAERASADASTLIMSIPVGSPTGAAVDPTGVAVDSSGNVWVTDSSPINHCVDEFSKSGQLLQTFGGPGSANEFNYPYGIAVDLSGNIWVADSDNNCVQEFSSNGDYIYSINGPVPSFPVPLLSPQGLTIDPSGYLDSRHVSPSDLGDHPKSMERQGNGLRDTGAGEWPV